VGHGWPSSNSLIRNLPARRDQGFCMADGERSFPSELGTNLQCLVRKAHICDDTNAACLQVCWACHEAQIRNPLLLASLVAATTLRVVERRMTKPEPKTRTTRTRRGCGTASGQRMGSVKPAEAIAGQSVLRTRHEQVGVLLEFGALRHGFPDTAIEGG
jgi:hypothetical protein